MISKRKIKHFLYKERCIKVFNRIIKFDILELFVPVLIILLIIDLICIGIWMANNIY